MMVDALKLKPRNFLSISCRKKNDARSAQKTELMRIKMKLHVLVLFDAMQLVFPHEGMHQGGC